MMTVVARDELDNRISILSRALSLAVSMLAPYEPGDSRAVSDEFVALAAVSTGDVSPEVMTVIDSALSTIKSSQ